MGTVIGINGSPRKTWNTAALLEHALRGAKSAGAKTELVHLYDLDYKGCISCFACKLKDGKSYGKCAVNDDITPVLEKIAGADAFILGSPVYLGTATGEMRSFLCSGAQDDTKGQRRALGGEPFSIQPAAPGGLLIGDDHRQIRCVICGPGQRLIVGRANRIEIAHISQG